MNAARRNIATTRSFPKNMMKKIFLFVILFFWLLPIKINLPATSFSPSIVLIFTLSGILFLVSAPRTLSRSTLNFIATATATLTFFLINSTINGGLDLNFITKCLLCLLIFFSAATIAVIFEQIYGKEFHFNLLLNLALAGFINSAIQIAVLLSPSISSFIYKLFLISDNSKIHLLQGYRSSGLFYTGSSILSAFNAFILFIGICLFFYHGKNKSFLKYFIFAIFSSLQILAITVSGRAGFLVLALSAPFLIWFLSVNYGSLKMLRDFLIISAIATILLCIFIYQIGFDNVRGILEWAFEFIYSYIDDGKIRTNSTDELFGQMYFLPNDAAQLFFGAGNFGRSENLPYIDSDSGYILVIFGSGFLGLAFSLLPYLFIYFNKRINGKTKEMILITKFMVVSIFILNFKDSYFYDASGITQLLFVIFASIIINQKPRLRSTSDVNHFGASNQSQHLGAINA